MSPLRHQNCSLPFPTAGIQYAQRSVTKFSQQLIQILPEDRLTKLTFGGAINVARKLFRDVIKIAIRIGRVPLTAKPLFCHTRAENEPLWCNITGNRLLYG